MQNVTRNRHLRNHMASHVGRGYPAGTCVIVLVPSVRGTCTHTYTYSMHLCPTDDSKHELMCCSMIQGAGIGDKNSIYNWSFCLLMMIHPFRHDDMLVHFASASASASADQHQDHLWQVLREDIEGQEMSHCHVSSALPQACLQELGRCAKDRDWPTPRGTYILRPSILL